MFTYELESEVAPVGEPTVDMVPVGERAAEEEVLRVFIDRFYSFVLAIPRLKADATRLL